MTYRMEWAVEILRRAADECKTREIPPAEGLLGPRLPGAVSRAHVAG